MKPTYREVESALLSRWPETTLEPSLDRIRAVCDVLGNPQASVPLIQLTGTNGKTSTSRMIDALVRALGLRTGRFTSPHLQSMRERISIDGEPVSEDDFVDAYADVAIFADLVDQKSLEAGGHRLSFFEMLVAMAYAHFADTPVDVAIVEVGMGGSWDATSIADAAVPVILPIDVDHVTHLGNTPADIAIEKAGIIKPGSRAVVAHQSPEVLEVIMRRAAEVGAPVLREGVDFGVTRRVFAVGGQQFSIEGLAGDYTELLMPLHGQHQASNAAVALAAVETFTGGSELDPELVQEAFGAVTSPGRLEIIRRSPSVVLDAAHNPHGAAALVETIQSEFTFSPLIGVVGSMVDKDVEEILRVLEPVLAHIVCTQNSTDRSMPAGELGEIAADLFGDDRVSVSPRLDDAIERAIALSESSEIGAGSGGVLITGSVVTVGEARTLLGGSL